ncbi:MAG: hypothetical protein JWM57_2225 [Phycisphaerales bacterium]|nr:hypothetical protein [Phycisphaerales bacterium]
MSAYRYSMLAVVQFVALLGTANAAPPITEPATMPTTAAAAPAMPAFLSGIVTLADGTTPVEKANVFARPVGDATGSGGWLAQTDKSGAFVLGKPLQPGTFVISVSEQSGNTTPLQQLAVVADAGPIGVRLRLPAATVRGRVTSPTGKPLAHLLVMLGRPNEKIFYTTNTDDSGAYALPHVLPGTYGLTASGTPTGDARDMLLGRVDALQVADADLTQDIAMKVRRPTTRGAGTSRPATPRPVSKVPTLTGTVTLADGTTPIVDTAVFGRMDDSANSDGQWLGHTNGKGAFSISQPIRPGTYHVQVLENLRYVAVQDVVITAGAAAPAVQLTMPGGGVTGFVHDDHGQAVENAEVQLVGMQNLIRAVTNDTGVYHIEHVPAGTYQASAIRTRINSGGTDIRWKTAEVRIAAGEIIQNFGPADDAPVAP